MTTLARSWRKARYGEVAHLHICTSVKGDALCGVLTSSVQRYELGVERATCPRCLSALRKGAL